MSADVGNAMFELVGALLGWLNVRQLLRDRSVSGVYWPVTAFFAAWGYWNLFYYPALGQWFSAWAGALLALANTAWVVLALRFRRRVSGVIGEVV